MSFRPEVIKSPSSIRNISSKNQLLGYIGEGQGRINGYFFYVEFTDFDDVTDGRETGSYRHAVEKVFDPTFEGPIPIIFTPDNQRVQPFDVIDQHYLSGQVKVLSNVELE